MFFFQDFTVQAVMEMCSAKSGLQLEQHEAIWHFLNKCSPRTVNNSSRSQFNSPNYMPLEFGLCSHCMVCAFGSNAGNIVGLGARESAENVGWFWLRVRIQCGLPLSPLMQGSVFLCLTVLFSSGDLEVSNSAIQIHCVRYILSSN